MALSDDTKQHLRNAVIVSSAAIPLAGGPISVLLDKYLPDHLTEKRDRLLRELDNRLAKLEETGRSVSVENERFSCIFVQVFHRAVYEYRQENIDCFRNLILNAAVHDDAQFDETTLFVRLIEQLTVDQIRILKGINAANGISKEEHSSLFAYATDTWPDVDQDYLMACVTELIRYNLVSSASQTPGERASQVEQDTDRHRLTGLGERFVAYIRDPDS